MPKKYKVFISHAGTDTWVARKIEADIANLGADTFLDEADIEIGEDFEERILEEIEKSDELLVLLTPWSLERPYIWIEIGALWSHRKRIVGVLYGISAQEISAHKYWPTLLKRISLIEINDFDRYLDELNRRIPKVTE
mgnify:CR=1 FL=1